MMVTRTPDVTRPAPSETCEPELEIEPLAVTTSPVVKLSAIEVTVCQVLTRGKITMSRMSVAAGKSIWIHCLVVPDDAHSFFELPKPSAVRPPYEPSLMPEGGDAEIEEDAESLTPARRAMLTVEAWAVNVGAAVALDEVDDDVAELERVTVTMLDVEGGAEGAEVTVEDAADLERVDEAPTEEAVDDAMVLLERTLEIEEGVREARLEEADEEDVVTAELATHW